MGFLDYDYSLSMHLDSRFSVILRYIVIAGVGWYAFSSLLAWRRLRQFPGPFLASFSYLWGFHAMVFGRLDVAIHGAQKKYGQLVRIGPNDLMIADPELMMHMSSARSKYVRGDWYHGLRLQVEGFNLLSQTDTAKHNRRKADMATGYSGRGRMNLEEDINSCIAVLKNVIRTKYVDRDGSKIMNYGEVIRFFQADLISLTGLGKAWGYLETETDHFDFLATVDAFIPFILTITTIPVLRHLVSSSWFLKLAGPRKTDKTGLGKWLNALKEEVDGKFGNALVKGERGCMLDEWIKHGLNPTDCEVELAIQMPAGVDTTVTTFRAIMLHLCSSPPLYQRLKEEIFTTISNNPESDLITYEQAKKMPLLQAIILEGLRILPPAPYGLPKRVPPEGEMIMGNFVPGGTDIYINSWSMLRDSSIFGERVDIFHPDRFLDDLDKSKQALRTKTVELVFGFGRWRCVGKDIAFMELSKVFVELFREFDFQIVHPDHPWHMKVYSAIHIENFFIRVTVDSRSESKDIK